MRSPSASPSNASRRSLAELLLRPFIALDPCARGALYALGIEQYWAAFADRRRARFHLQRTLPSPFRAQFLLESGLTQYSVEDPRHLKRELRNARWQKLCAALDNWATLNPDGQCRLVLLVHALCFYPLVYKLVPEIPNESIAAEPDLAELAYWRASSRYVLNRPDRIQDYGNAELSEFERVATHAAHDTPVAFNAALKVFVHSAKTGAPVQDLVEYRARAERFLKAALAEVDGFTGKLLESRFYRASAFVPQAEGNRAEVIRIMDLAEAHALAIKPANAAQQLLYRENLHPLLESRTKEAMWLGDSDLALARAHRVIELDPYDAKTWLELGQVRLKRQEYAQAAEAYVSAATLGPPASAIGRHMAGLCFRNLGQPLLAAHFFKSAAEIDAAAISPHDEIQYLPDSPVVSALRDWSMQSFSL